jgi:hypothetical protein
MSGDFGEWNNGPAKHEAPKPEKYHWIEEKKGISLWTVVKLVLWAGVIYEILRLLKVVH